MIDANAVVQQVKAGAAPASWQVIPARGSFFMWNAFGGVALVIGAVAAAIYLFLSGTIVGIGVNDQTPDNVAFFWFIVDMVVLAALAIGGVVFAIRRALAIGSADEQMLVLLPEGFVKRTGTSEKDTLAVNYANLITATPAVRNGSQYLDVRTKAGKRVSIEIDGRFGNAKTLVRQISGQHAHFVTASAGGRS
jgi:hypothetical protein